MSDFMITDNNRIYEKRGPLAVTGGIAAGTAAFGAAALGVEFANGRFLLKNAIDELGKANSPETKKAVGQAFRESGLAEKGVTILDLKNYKAKMTPLEYVKKNGIPNTRKKLNEFLTDTVFKPMVAQGQNAFYNPEGKQVIINSRKSGFAFHEMGHALNHTNGGFWKLVQNLRFPMMAVAPLALTVSLFKRKKVEGEEPTGIFDKATTFIKDNAGKISLLSFVPMVAEELEATRKGNKLAAKYLSKENLKHIVKGNGRAGMTYVLAGLATGGAVYLANKVKDAIAGPKRVA